MNDKMIYIDKEGGYGDASGLIILLEKDLGENPRNNLNNALDGGEHLVTWAYRQMVGKKTTTHVIRRTGVVATKQNMADLDYFLKREEAL